MVIVPDAASTASIDGEHLSIDNAHRPASRVLATIE
jgi:hypothetical protein